MIENQAVQAYTDAWTQSIEAISELVAPLPADSWNRPTECPGWSVRDIVSHVIAVESELLGDPRPIHSLPSDLRHISSELSRYLELPVDKRRCHTAPEMTGELEYVIIRRSRAIRNAKTEAGDAVRFPAGPFAFDLPYEQLLRIRTFDVWVHEQDLRRALREPGNLDSPSALISRDMLVDGLPKVVAKVAGAPAGSTVAFDVTGPVEFLRTVRVDDNGAARSTTGSAWARTSSSPSTGRPTCAWPPAVRARRRWPAPSGWTVTPSWRTASWAASR